MKSRWSGSLTVVKLRLLVSDFHSEMSIVIPRSRSAFRLSRTHASLNEPLPSCRDSFSNFAIVRSSIPPHLSIRLPVVVDFQESRWPMTTTLMRPFSLGV